MRVDIPRHLQKLESTTRQVETSISKTSWKVPTRICNWNQFLIASATASNYIKYSENHFQFTLNNLKFLNI